MIRLYYDRSPGLYYTVLNFGNGEEVYCASEYGATSYPSSHSVLELRFGHLQRVKFDRLRDQTVGAVVSRLLSALAVKRAGALNLHMIRSLVPFSRLDTYTNAPHMRADHIEMRAWRKQLGSLLRDYINASRNHDPDDFSTAAESLRAHLNGIRHHRGETQRVRDVLDSVAFKLDYVGEDAIVYCDGCRHFEHACESRSTRSGRRYCETCTNEDLVVMAENGEYEHRDSVFYWESDEEYHYDPEPHDDDDDDDDDDDGLWSWGSSTERLSHDRSFVPSPAGDFTMGVELEVQATSHPRSDCIDDCLDYFNNRFSTAPNYVMLKADGSLDEDLGFEIVTAARRLTDHIEMFGPWKTRGMNAWDNGNCGMHVHIDSRAFTALSLGKFLMFYNNDSNSQFIRGIAGRHPKMDDQAEQYARALDQEFVESPAKALKGENGNRYYMVNLTNLSYAEAQRLSVENHERDSKGNYSTVELRVFRASLSKKRLLAQLEFAHASVMFCRTASWQGLTGMHFLTWLGERRGVYPHLSRWFGLTIVKTPHTNTPVTAQPADV